MHRGVQLENMIVPFHLLVGADHEAWSIPRGKKDRFGFGFFFGMAKKKPAHGFGAPRVLKCSSQAAKLSFNIA